MTVQQQVIPVFENYLNKTINITQASHLLVQTGTTVPDNSMAPEAPTLHEQ